MADQDIDSLARRVFAELIRLAAMDRLGPRWACHQEGLPVHVWPIDDLIDHDLDLDGAGCPCGPRVEEDGDVVIHHSLDGRERSE